MDLQALWGLLLTGLMRGSVYALMAVGLSLIFGVMNVPQFAHGEFYMLGAYVAYFTFHKFGLNPLLTIIVAALSGFLAGALMEKAVLFPLHRRQKEQWVMNTFLLTVGISFVMQNGAQALWGSNYLGITHYWQGSIQLTKDMAIPFDRAISFIIAIVAILAFWLFLGRTRMGRAIRAAAQDETGAMLVGIDLDRVRTLTFALGAMLAAIAGASLLSMNPAHPTMGREPLYKSWVVVIVGGLGNIGAAIPAGFLVGMLETLTSYFLGASWQNVVSLSIIIVILLFKPNGIFASEVKGIWER
ncbi:MAG TPA: branched-chain amino acid ABC transporter permease [Acidobacteriota bacterium]|jgi:branched-chain amino acid transport system permease protein